jgi:glyoxylase-like metal-dependent hydrolase (beta-lactamase superfamily II)
MITEQRIGRYRIVGISEYYGPTHQPEAVFPEFDRAAFAKREAELPPGHWYPHMDRFVIGIQLWAVFAGTNLILIDAGVGNGKTRPAARMNRLNTLVPAWMEAAGIIPDRVTHVVMTHLHSDHIGWNTRAEGDGWVPTFPKARHILPRRDFDHFQTLSTSGKAGDTSFSDSIEPVLQAGLVDFIDGAGRVADCLDAVETVGHTPGQMSYWLRDGDEVGVFCADILHHPVQILFPNLNTAFCVMPDAAKATRRSFLEQASAESALVMPCHFPPPHCGHVGRRGEDFTYEPARRT